VADRLIRYIQSRIKELGRNGAVIGVSGGIDSAVVLHLCLQALGRERILALILPEYDSDPASIRLARRICHGIPFQVIPIGPILKKMGIYRYFQILPFQNRLPYRMKSGYVRNVFKKVSKDLYLKFLTNNLPSEIKMVTAYLRAKNRIRMAILYQKAEELDYAVVGTINRTEYLLGLFVPFGDGAADLMPLLPFYKSEIFQIAEELGIDPEIRSRRPTPDLIPGLSDEEIIGLSYEEIDNGLAVIEGREKQKINDEKLNYIRSIYERAEPIRRSFPPVAEEILE